MSESRHPRVSAITSCDGPKIERQRLHMRASSVLWTKYLKSVPPNCRSPVIEFLRQFWNSSESSESTATSNPCSRLAHDGEDRNSVRRKIHFCRSPLRSSRHRSHTWCGLISLIESVLTTRSKLASASRRHSGRDSSAKGKSRRRRAGPDRRPARISRNGRVTCSQREIETGEEKRFRQVANHVLRRASKIRRESQNRARRSHRRFRECAGVCRRGDAIRPPLLDQIDSFLIIDDIGVDERAVDPPAAFAENVRNLHDVAAARFVSARHRAAILSRVLSIPLSFELL